VDRQNLLEELQEIFRDILDQPDLILTRDSNASNVEDWDSLAHINLVTSIEKRYSIKFALGELQDLKNVGDMIDIIEIKLAAKETNTARVTFISL
jgi:acyl carrier protein